ncbi:hypothetical protein RMCBS344292_11138 [Rhizopus microsporus]|nr:hypothetical protein RMCBS344292_11138 [Rhizopus microsporus]
MDNFIQTFSCTCENVCDKSNHILQVHLRDILSNKLQPAFKRNALHHPALKRPSRYARDDELHEQQAWKSDHHVDILYWIIKKADPLKLEENLNLLIPPVLIVLDDYDIQYRTKGVSLVHVMITRMNSAGIIKNNLDNVFLEVVIVGLDAPLVEATYPCIIDLIAYTKQGQSRCDLYERVMTEGILTGLLHAGEKIRFLPILLQPIPRLFEELGASSVQYLKGIIPSLCQSLSTVPYNDSLEMRRINKLAAHGLIAVIRECWPRISTYEGIIMSSVAKCWSYYFDKQDREMLELQRQLYKVFEAACQGAEEADKEALLKYRPNVFEPLFA